MNQPSVNDILTNSRSKPVLSVSPEEAFRLLGISRSTGYRLIKDGTIRVARLNRRLLVPMTVLQELLGEKN